MIDTVGFFVPISQNMYNTLKNVSIRTQRLCQLDGDIHFEYHKIDVQVPSHNYNILFGLDDKKWISGHIKGKKVLASGYPYLRFEFSVPKVVYGHNLQSVGINDIFRVCGFVKKQFEKLMMLSLPDFSNWYPYRIDVCSNFVMPSEASVISYIHYLHGIDYPRRSPIIYDTSLYFSSRVSSFKIYAKGPEFRKHDYQRLSFLGSDVVSEYYEKSKKILRIEVELKRRLQYISKNSKIQLKNFNGYCCLNDLLKHFDLQKEFNRIIDKFLCGLVKKVMRLKEVRNRLKIKGSSASGMYGFYVELLTLGKKATRKNYSKNMFYRYLRVFRELNIPLVSCDLRKIDISHNFPVDFSLDVTPENKYYQICELIAA